LVFSVLPWRENLALGEWPTVFGDGKMSSAVFDRLTPHCEILDAGKRPGLTRAPLRHRASASGRIRCLKTEITLGHDRGSRSTPIDIEEYFNLK
jgi:hypothetical protein